MGFSSGRNHALGIGNGHRGGAYDWKKNDVPLKKGEGFPLRIGAASLRGGQKRISKKEERKRRKGVRKKKRLKTLKADRLS